MTLTNAYDGIRQNIRQTMRERRNALEPEHQAAAAEKLQAQLEELLTPLPKAIAAYIADDGEISPASFIARLKGARTRVYLPYVDESGTMQMLHWSNNKRLISGRWGIMHPEPTDSSCLEDIRQLDAVLVPMVAFDAIGNRLGRGGGYYDKLLSNCDASVLRIGLAHAFQQTDSVPTYSWDEKVDWIATDEKIFKPGA